MAAKFEAIRHQMIDRRVQRIVRANALWRAWEPALAAFAVVVAFGLAVEYVPGLAPLLGAFADAAMATKP